jgi:molecular chaperone GrpE
MLSSIEGMAKFIFNMQDDADPKNDEVEVEEEFVETNEDGEELSGKDQLKKLRQKLREAIEEKQKYLTNWQRDKAEFINVRKRDEESKTEYLKFAEGRFIEEILPVLDSFDLALHHGKNQDNVPKDWLSGLESVYQQFLKVLERYDVSSFGEIGENFDPNFHHSISTIKAETGQKEHTLAEILQKGYMMKGRVIRPALVKVFE